MHNLRSEVLSMHLLLLLLLGHTVLYVRVERKEKYLNIHLIIANC